jgi:hypothetical protein
MANFLSVRQMNIPKGIPTIYLFELNYLEEL